MNYGEKIALAASNWRAAGIVAENEEESLQDAEKKLNDAIIARQYIQDAAQAVQQAAHRRIAGVVTRCLTAVFGDDAYEFRIEFQQKRGRTEAHLLFVRDGLELSPLDSTGGGVVDVAAFALRLACLMLQRPPVRRLLVLDEPFRFVSVGYRPAIRQLMVDLADELGIQFVVVTHMKDLLAGKVVEM